MVHGYTVDLKFAEIADYLYLIFSVERPHFKKKIYFQSESTMIILLTLMTLLF